MAFGQYGDLKSVDPSPLPEPFERIVGKPIAITRDKLRHYVKGEKSSNGHIVRPPIRELDIGGSFDRGLVRRGSKKDGEQARYFVIHDTSTPEGPSLPDNMNELSWSYNDLFEAGTYSDWWRIVNVMVSRAGTSRTFTEFATTRPDYEFFDGSDEFGKGRATRLEGSRSDGMSIHYPGVRAVDVRSAFIHVENVQPRRFAEILPACRSKPVGKKNACIAPQNGFTDAQYERLALIYIAASVRRGQWLIPAFHANVDRLEGRKDSRRDDPQNFDLVKWGQSISALTSRLE